MKDRFGRTFRKKEILNSDSIGFIESKSLNDFTVEELGEKTVLITDSDGRKRLYLFSDLQQWLKAGRYCRLNDPFTRQDILPQLPEFNAALQFEQNAAHYNAHILNKYPSFISLLSVYVRETLNIEDEHAYLDTDKNTIYANRSEELDRVYQQLFEMPEEMQEAFYSLFITNRTYYQVRCQEGLLLTLPAKWIPNPNDPTVRDRQYTPYPHRNVLIADLITQPEDGCLHSWGMDVLYLLLEYQIGTNKTVQLFNVSDNPSAYQMEQTLRQRIEMELTPGSLNPQRGEEVLAQVKKVVTDNLLPVPSDSFESTGKITRLDKACTQYMNYLLDKLNIIKECDFPDPNKLSSENTLIIQKYKAVYELYSSLDKKNRYIDDEDRFENFTYLYNQKDRQNTIASHRDNMGIRFLNITLSIFSLGIKNLLTHYFTEGYYGFWTSRGRNFNENVAEILVSSPSK